MSIIFKAFERSLIFGMILMLSCNCSSSVEDFLEQEFGIPLNGKIDLEIEKSINGDFTGDFTNLKVFKIKESYYNEIKEAGLRREFNFFKGKVDLPLTDQIFLEYIKDGHGMYKYYKGNSKSDMEIIILNEKDRFIIYYFCHI